MSMAFDGAWATSAPARIPSSVSTSHSSQVAAGQAPPAPVLNGGLYTGQPFAPGAPWGNVPVVPDAGYMTSVNLLSAHPPPGATSQFSETSFRDGNNTPATIPQGILSPVAHMCHTLCVRRPRERAFDMTVKDDSRSGVCAAEGESFGHYARW